MCLFSPAWEVVTGRFGSKTMPVLDEETRPRVCVPVRGVGLVLFGCVFWRWLHSVR